MILSYLHAFTYISISYIYVYIYTPAIITECEPEYTVKNNTVNVTSIHVYIYILIDLI